MIWKLVTWKRYIPQILSEVILKFWASMWNFRGVFLLVGNPPPRPRRKKVVYLEVCPPQQQFGPTDMDHLTVGYIDVFLLLHLGWWRQGVTGLVIVIYHLQLGISALYCRLLVPGSESGPRSDERMVIKSTLVDPFSTFSIIFGMFNKTPGCSQIWHLRSRTANKKRQMPLQRLRRNLSEWGGRGAFVRMLTMFREVVLNFWLR